MFHVGARIDRYRLLAELGSGGQGAVFRVEDLLEPDVPKVVKLFSTRGAAPASLERLRREARLLAGLDHPSLVKCFGLFEDLQMGALGLVLEHVEGVTLRAAMHSARWSSRLADAALRRVAECLAYVHAQRCVHRDLKAENVLLEERFFAAPADPRGVRIIDLGIAADGQSGEHLTQPGMVIGTLPYVAPEVITPSRFQGSRVAPAVDVFAFGVLAWELLVGGHPAGVGEGAGVADFAAVYLARVGDPGWGLAPVAEPWRTVIRACLAIEPRDRPRDGAALAAMLATTPGHTVLRTAVQAPLFAAMPPADGPARDARRAGRASGAPRALLAVAGVGLVAVGLLGGWCLARSPSQAADEETSPGGLAPAGSVAGLVPLPGNGPVAVLQDPPPVSAGLPGGASPAAPTDAGGPSSDAPCRYVTDGSGLNAQGDVDMSLEWAFLRADLRWLSRPLTGVGGPWELSSRAYFGRMGTRNLADAPRIVPRELRHMVNPLVISHGQVVYRCFPKMPERWAATALTRGVCIRCAGAEGFEEYEYQLCSCLADPRKPSP